MDYQRDEHRIHLILYHLVWCPKRRKPVLVGDIADDCHRLIGEVCQQYGWEVLQLVIQPDHLHLFVRAFPETPASDIVKTCKGKISYELRRKYPNPLRKLPSMWTRSYFAATAGNVSQETIQQYIEMQKGI